MAGRLHPPPSPLNDSGIFDKGEKTEHPGINTSEITLKSAFNHRFAQHYDAWYDHPKGAQVLKLERALIKRCLEPCLGERLLDIGCGTGMHLSWFKEMGLQVTGLDASPYMIERAKRRLRDGADLHMGWAEHLPFDDDDFDVSTLINTLEFVDDPEKALTEAFRVTRRRVALGVLNKYAFLAVHRRLKGLLEDSVYRQARFFSVWELKEMVHKIMGPTKIRWGTVLFFPLTFMRVTHSVEDHPLFQQNPWGAFIVMTVDISYRLITCKDPMTPRLHPKGGQLPQGTPRVLTVPPAWRERQSPKAILHP
jgi:ubiquinone/menaquinone biosynthesis C-methylase UbiE